MDVAQQLPHRKDLQTAFGDIQYCGASFGTERMQNSMNIHLSASDWKPFKMSSTLAVRRVPSQSSKPWDSPKVKPRVDSSTVWGFIPSTRNSLLWPISTSRASYPRTLTTEFIAGIIAIQQDKGPDFGAKLNMKKHRILLESCQDDERAVTLQRRFHDTFQIPLARIHIHPDNIPDPSEKATARLHYGDIILGIPASPFAEFIDAFVANAVDEISVEWRLASHRLKEEPHHLWYLLKHILASKFTYLFRGIPPRFA